MFQVTGKATVLRRSRFDIIAAILQVTSQKAAVKTHIMCKCNLSFKQLHSHLQFLVEMGLLRSVEEDVGRDQNRVWFETTKKGEAFVSAYNNLNSLLVID